MTLVWYTALLVPRAIYIMWAKLAKVWNNGIPNIYGIISAAIHNQHMQIIFHNTHLNLDINTPNL